MALTAARGSEHRCERGERSLSVFSLLVIVSSVYVQCMIVKMELSVVMMYLLGEDDDYVSRLCICKTMYLCISLGKMMR